jgi:hypothetical protein
MTARGVVATEPEAWKPSHRERRGGMTVSQLRSSTVAATVRSNRWIVSPTHGRTSTNLNDPAVQNAMKVCGI